MVSRSKPDNYIPPYPAYQIGPEHQEAFATALIGVQYHRQEDASSCLYELLGLLVADAQGRPEHVDQCTYIDPEGYRNDICIPYWINAEELTKFFARQDVLLWQSRLPMTGPVGWWRESFFGDMTSADVSFSRKTRYGISRMVGGGKRMRFHGYMGSMRDRVPDFLSGLADGQPRRLVRQNGADTRGKHLRVTDLPHNLCYIRTAFGADHAPEEEQRAFEEMILPVLRNGAAYLQNNSVESGCISSRCVNDVKHGFDSQVEVEVLAWFMTLQELERWTASHPLHLSILRNAAAFHKRFDFKSSINQGHEVFVVPRGQLMCEYWNCHAKTGFLPFFPKEEIDC